MPHRDGREKIPAMRKQPADEDPRPPKWRCWGMATASKPQHHQQDALRQDELPMRVDRRRDLAPDGLRYRVGCHVMSPKNPGPASVTPRERGGSIASRQPAASVARWRRRRESRRLLVNHQIAGFPLHILCPVGVWSRRPDHAFSLVIVLAAALCARPPAPITCNIWQKTNSPDGPQSPPRDCAPRGLRPVQLWLPDKPNAGFLPSRPHMICVCWPGLPPEDQALLDAFERSTVEGPSPANGDKNAVAVVTIALPDP